MFGSTPFAHDFRPYISHLYPRDSHSEVLHPNVAGTAVVTETSSACEHGCEIGNWDGSWFALHDPATGQGAIARHAASSYPAALWVDKDAASFTTSSSVLLLQPAGGFTGHDICRTTRACTRAGSRPRSAAGDAAEHAGVTQPSRCGDTPT